MYHRQSQFVNNLDDVLEQHFADPNFNLQEMAELVGLGSRQLQRRIKESTGQTPNQYVRSYRLDRSVEKLKYGWPVGETARSVGFSSQSYFAVCFKDKYGVTPSQLSRISTNMD